MLEPEGVRARAAVSGRGILMGPVSPETWRGADASGRNPRASGPFSVRAIQNSNLWPLAPGDGDPDGRADGRAGHPWTAPRGTPSDAGARSGRSTVGQGGWSRSER